MLKLIRTEEELISTYFKISPKSKKIKLIQQHINDENITFEYFDRKLVHSYKKYNAILNYRESRRACGFYSALNIFKYHKTYRIIFCPFIYLGDLRLNYSPLIQKDNKLYKLTDIYGELPVDGTIHQPMKIQMSSCASWFNESIILIKSKEQYQLIIDEIRKAENGNLIRKYEKLSK